MKIKIKYEQKIMSMPDEIYTYLKKATGKDAKVIFAIAHDSNVDISKISKDLGLSESDILSSISFWRGTGIIEQEDEDDTPKVDVKQKLSIESISYTSDDVEKLIDKTPELNFIITKCEEIMDKPFTSADSKVVIYMYDHLGLDAEYIFLLCKHIKNLGHSGMKYIEKVATNLYDQKIDTFTKLTEYVKKKNKEHDLELYIRSLYGMGERSLTKTEEEIIAKWDKEKHSREELKEAYDKMMNAIDKPTMKYMDKVLESLKEPVKEDVSNDTFTPTKSKRGRKRKTDESSFDINEFFQTNVNGSRGGK